MQHLLAAAARNNAILCDRLTRAQGFGSRFRPGLWRAIAGAPPLVPDLVTLPGESGAALSAEIRILAERKAGLALKDSDRSLDLAALGFAPLFDAEWMALPDWVKTPGRPRTVRIRDPRDLPGWEAGWRQGEDLPEAHTQFPPSLLARSDFAAVARLSRDGRLNAGGLLLFAGGVVGISNLFTSGPAPARLLLELAAAARELWPDRPIVTYAAGAALEAARAAGFRPFGPLRVWHRPAAD